VQVPLSFGRFRFDTKHFINLCHNLGKRVDYWTINNKEEAERLFNLGADGIITDVPALISSRLE
jgi:glycerophosphoryl diester phosphodiesterase